MLDVASCSFIETVYFLFIRYIMEVDCVLTLKMLYVLYYNYALYTFTLVRLLSCKDKKSLS